jgi:hypothetical protein
VSTVVGAQPSGGKPFQEFKEGWDVGIIVLLKNPLIKP